jgi:hypothetical protein
MAKGPLFFGVTRGEDQGSVSPDSEHETGVWPLDSVDSSS